MGLTQQGLRATPYDAHFDSKDLKFCNEGLAVLWGVTQATHDNTQGAISVSDQPQGLTYVRPLYSMTWA